MKKLILILCLLILTPACASTRYNRDYNERKGLMLLRPNEYTRNKPLKFDKEKLKKQLRKKNKIKRR
jgi:hypothetical protein